MAFVSVAKWHIVAAVKGLQLVLGVTVCDTAFHTRPVFFTPLVNQVAMPNGADTYYTGNELLRGHTNINPIGNRARFIDALYIDGRRKKLVADSRFGNKAQMWEFDKSNCRPVAKPTVDKLSLITGNAPAGVIAWEAGKCRAPVQTKRESTLLGDAIVGSASYA